MSSWANRYIPRKRDLSQIPADLRPQIIPRVQRPEIIQSESYQLNNSQQNSFDSFNHTPFDEIFSSTRGNNRNNQKDNKNTVIEPVNNQRNYIPRKINANPGPGAFELVYNDKSFVFVILRHLRNVRDNDLWISSYNSIRKFYTNKIIIIDDNSSVNTVDGKLFNTEVIKSEFNGAGELLPYHYFLENKWADKMIFLHDSMFINRPFKDSELDSDVKFHWYFDQELDNDTKHILFQLSLLKNSKKLIDFVKNPYNKWKGCSGVASIIDYNIIVYLEAEYKLFSNLILSIKQRKERKILERIFAIVLYADGIINDENCSNFGNILKYPGAFESENNNMETATHIVQQKGYDTAIIKVWRGR